VKNFYFDDQAWVVRYLVVDTSTWLGGREVLISPYSISQCNWTEGFLTATISKAQVKDSPSVDSDKPVSRQYERTYLGYYGYPYTGAEPDCGARAITLGVIWAGYSRKATITRGTSDPHRRTTEIRICVAATQSTAIISGRAMERSGTCKGFLLDDRTWSIRYLIINTAIGGSGIKCWSRQSGFRT